MRLDDDNDGVGKASAQQGRGAVVLSRIQQSSLQWYPKSIYGLGTTTCYTSNLCTARAAVGNFNFRAGSTFPVPVCTVPHRHWVNKADTQQDHAGATRLTRSDFMLHIG